MRYPTKQASKELLADNSVRSPYWLKASHLPSNNICLSRPSSGPRFNINTILGIPIIKITLPWDFMIFVLEISVLVR